MRILLTNDDGIHAEGLEHLAQAFTEASLGEVWVVAPADEQSATSHAISLGRPLRIRRFEERSFSVTGTPTDCVYVGVHHLMKGRAPDLVVSGINHGANLGTDVTYSGTIGGAMEGCGLGATSLAISSLGQGPTDLRGAAQFALAMARKALEEGLPEGVFLNLNVPKGWRPAHGWRVGGLGVRHYGESVLERRDPRQGPYYWIGGPPITHDDIPGSDCNIVEAGRASVTPLHMDLTHHDTIRTIQGWSADSGPDTGAQKVDG